MLDKRIILSGHDMIIQLPARYVTEVTEVIIDGNVHEHYHIDTNGILRVFGVPFVARYASVIVRYVAGLPEEMMHPIKELIAHRVTHAMAVPAGITSGHPVAYPLPITPTGSTTAGRQRSRATTRNCLYRTKCRGCFDACFIFLDSVHHPPQTWNKDRARICRARLDKPRCAYDQ